MCAAKKIITTLQAIEKIKHYCATSEHCQSEVRAKLSQYGMDADAIESVICDLISEGYINEYRYAHAFIQGKFKIKGWGKNKIIASLRAKHISTPCILSALQTINDTAYQEKLQHLIQKWLHAHPEKLTYSQRAKLMRYLLSKGYNMEDINTAINSEITI